MEDAARKGPGRLRRALALAAALAIGGTGFCLSAILCFYIGFSGLTGPAIALAPLFAIGTAGTAILGVATRERILRRKGEPRPRLASPRGWRAVVVWGIGSIAGFAPIPVFPLIAILPQEPVPLGVTLGSTLLLYFVIGPTVGLLVTRALCRRWGTQAPPASPAASPRPAPAVDPAADRPGPTLLPATA